MADISELIIQVKQTNQTISDINKVNSALKNINKEAVSVGKILFAGWSFTKIIDGAQKLYKVWKDQRDTLKQFDAYFGRFNANANRTINNIANKFHLTLISAKRLMNIFAQDFNGKFNILLSTQMAGDLSIVAKQIEKVFGTELSIVTKKLSSAIAGNADALNQFGLSINTSSKSFNDLVKKIQITKGVTEENARSLAIYQSVLEKFKNTFNNLSFEVSPFLDIINRFNDLKKRLIIIYEHDVSKILVSFITGITNAFLTIFETISKFVWTAKELQTRFPQFEGLIKNYVTFIEIVIVSIGYITGLKLALKSLAVSWNLLLRVVPGLSQSVTGLKMLFNGIINYVIAVKNITLAQLSIIRSNVITFFNAISTFNFARRAQLIQRLIMRAYAPVFAAIGNVILGIQAAILYSINGLFNVVANNVKSTFITLYNIISSVQFRFGPLFSKIMWLLESLQINILLQLNNTFVGISRGIQYLFLGAMTLIKNIFGLAGTRINLMILGFGSNLFNGINNIRRRTINLTRNLTDGLINLLYNLGGNLNLIVLSIGAALYRSILKIKAKMLFAIASLNSKINFSVLTPLFGKIIGFISSLIALVPIAKTTSVALLALTVPLAKIALVVGGLIGTLGLLISTAAKASGITWDEILLGAKNVFFKIGDLLELSWERLVNKFKYGRFLLTDQMLQNDDKKILDAYNAIVKQFREIKKEQDNLNNVAGRLISTRDKIDIFKKAAKQAETNIKNGDAAVYKLKQQLSGLMVLKQWYLDEIKNIKDTGGDAVKMTEAIRNLLSVNDDITKISKRLDLSQKKQLNNLKTGADTKKQLLLAQYKLQQLQIDLYLKSLDSLLSNLSWFQDKMKKIDDDLKQVSPQASLQKALLNYDERVKILNDVFDTLINDKPRAYELQQNTLKLIGNITMMKYLALMQMLNRQRDAIAKTNNLILDFLAKAMEFKPQGVEGISSNTMEGYKFMTSSLGAVNDLGPVMRDNNAKQLAAQNEANKIASDTKQVINTINTLLKQINRKQQQSSSAGTVVYVVN